MSDSQSRPAFDNSSDSGYNNDTDLSKPVLIDMKRHQPTHPPHDHDYEHDPHDPDNEFAHVYKCKHCDTGILVAK